MPTTPAFDIVATDLDGTLLRRGDTVSPVPVPPWPWPQPPGPGI